MKYRSPCLHVKPKVLIVADFPGWAYDNVSNAFMQVLKWKYDFTKVFAAELPLIDHRSFDLVYCMWWKTDFLERNFVPKEKLCIQVASFWSWQQKYKIPLNDLVEKYLNRACAVSVNCPGLYDLIAPLHRRVFLNPSGVDVDKFRPYLPRSSDAGQALIVGWTGSTAIHGDNKGLLDLIIPVCESLNNVTLKTVTKEKNWLPHVRMSEFYREIDVYLCASQSEGTPNPVLEAAASARAVISTPVGIVPLLIHQGINGMIVEREFTPIRSAVKRLRDDRTLCANMGAMNRQVIENEGWSWENRARNYQVMFDNILNGG